MRILLPMNQEDHHSLISSRFARAPLFMIFDTQTGGWETIENEAAHESGGAGTKAAGIVADLGVDVVITPQLGEKAADVLKMAEIKIYESIHGNAEENIGNFEIGKLNPLHHIHSGFHHGHGKS